MANTTNRALKTTQAKTLDGALFIRVYAGSKIINERYVGGKRYVITNEGAYNVKATFGPPYSFMVTEPSTITEVEVVLYDPEGQRGSVIVFRDTLNIPVLNADIVYVNELSFTLTSS